MIHDLNPTEIIYIQTGNNIASGESERERKREREREKEREAVI